MTTSTNLSLTLAPTGAAAEWVRMTKDLKLSATLRHIADAYATFVALGNFIRVDRRNPGDDFMSFLLFAPLATRFDVPADMEGLKALLADINGARAAFTKANRGERHWGFEAVRKVVAEEIGRKEARAKRAV